MQSTEFEFTVADTKSSSLVPINAVVGVWHEEAEKALGEEGVLLEVVVRESKILRKGSVCDEVVDAVVFTGVYNPEFNASPTEWRGVVRLVCSKVRKALGQTTATLVMRDVDFTYLKD